MPLYKTENRTKITGGMRKALYSHKLRTQVSPNKLINEYCHDKPPLLTREMIEKWMTLHTSHLNIEIYEYVLKKYESVPEASQKKVPFTQAMRDELSVHREKTGVGIQKLLNTIFENDKDCPEGLNIRYASNWLRENTRCRNINETHYNYVLSCYRVLRDGHIRLNRDF